MNTTDARAPLAAGHPRVAGLVIALIAICVVVMVVSLVVVLRSADVEDETGFLAGTVICVTTMSAAIILGFFYPVWFIEPRAVHAIRDQDPDSWVWPGVRTRGLVELASVVPPASLARKVYFAVSPESFTAWHREGAEVVRVLEIPRTSIRSVTQEPVSTWYDLQPGVHVTFGPTDAPTLLQLMPRAILNNSDVAARALTAALAPA